LSITLAVAVTIEPKRVSSKETIESNTGEAVEQVLVDLPVHVGTRFFIQKGSSLTWQ